MSVVTLKEKPHAGADGKEQNMHKKGRRKKKATGRGRSEEDRSGAGQIHSPPQQPASMCA